MAEFARRSAAGDLVTGSRAGNRTQVAENRRLLAELKPVAGSRSPKQRSRSDLDSVTLEVHILFPSSRSRRYASVTARTVRFQRYSRSSVARPARAISS